MTGRALLIFVSLKFFGASCIERSSAIDGMTIMSTGRINAVIF